MRMVRLLIGLALLGAVFAACPTTQYSTGTRFSASSFAAGQTINIAAGTTYLFDLAESPTYGNIYVSGTLVFADEKDVALNAAYLMVKSGGKLIIGSCDCPFVNQATLTFYGSDKSLNPDNFGTKGIACSDGGTVLLFGKLFGPSWTTLGATAPVGATQIVLSETAAWKVGDRIAIASTDYQQNQAETVNITAIVSGTTFTIAPPLKYMHHSGTYYNLQEKAEVARLNRNILIQGDPSSDTTRFGVHTIFANAFTEVRISGVEIFRGGQAGVLARYPIHFHFAKDVSSRAFLKDSSVHDAYQRCYTVHHTDWLLVQRNVGYNTRGHCFFLEDGIEMNNQFYWNLGFKIAKPLDAERLIPSDTDPAVFWVTNPNNTFVSNVAAGGPAHCWWMAFPVNPTGPSATDTMCPRRTPLQYFAHNKAHSCGQDCMHTDRGPDFLGVPGGSALGFNWPDASGKNRWANVGAGYNPQSNPAGLNQSSSMVEAIFNNFHAYRCQGHGTWTRNGMVTFYQPIYADNSIGITFATNGGYGNLIDGTFIGQTANLGTPSPGENRGPDNRTLPSYGSKTFPIRGYEFYDGPNSANNIRCYAFINNVDRNASCISMLRRDEFQISSTNEAKDVGITDGSVPVAFPDWLHDGDRQSVFVDLDGSVSGRPPVGVQKVVVTNRAQFLKTSSCVDNSETTGTMFCPNQYGRFGWDWDTASDPTFWPNTTGLDSLARLSRSDQPASIYMPVCGGACNGDTRTLGTPRRSFQMTFPLAPVYPQLRDIMLKFNHSPPKSLRMRITYTDAFYNPATGIRNEVTVAICVGTSTRFFVDAVKPVDNSGCKYGYASRDPVASAAPSLAALRTNPVLVDYNNRGKNMWFLDTASGYLYVRFAVLENRTNLNYKDAYPATEAQFKFINVPTTVATCPTLTGGVGADRGIPPIAAVPAPPAFGAPAPGVPRDDTGSICSAGSTVSITVATISTATTGTTSNDATALAASITSLSTLTANEASLSMSTTAQSTTSVSLSTSTSTRATSTSSTVAASTSAVSTSNSASTSAARSASTTSNVASTSAASTTGATTRTASTTAQSTTVAGVTDSTVAATLTGSTTVASTASATSSVASTTAQTTSVSATLAAGSTTNAAVTNVAANSAASTAAAESTVNAASATSIVSSTFVAATNAASTTTTTAATEAASTTALETLLTSTVAAESTTGATATTSGTGAQTFTVQLHWCPADTGAYETGLAAGLGAYASAVLNRPSTGEFTAVVTCPTNGDLAYAVVTYTGSDPAIVNVIIAAANEGSLQADSSFTAACTGTCATNVNSATNGSPNSGGKKKGGIPFFVWIIVAIVIVLLIAGLVGVAIFFYCKMQGGGRGSTRAPLKPMYNLDEMYSGKTTA